MATRRTFLKQSWAAVAGLGVLARAPGTALAGAPAIPVVDTHQHLWDTKIVNPPWLKTSPLNRPFTPVEYAAATEGLGIVKSVYMEVAVDPADHVTEAQQVIDLCRRGTTPTCAAVIGGRPGDAGFAAYIRRFAASGYVKGVRQILKAGPDGALAVPENFAAGLRLLGELGLCFDLCVPPQTLAEGARLVEQSPDTRVVIDHCGNANIRAFRPDAGPLQAAADVWRRGIERLARRPHTVCKISGIVSQVTAGAWGPEDLAPVINHCLDTFGPDRVMFASDWPVCTKGAALRDWVAALRAIVASRPADQQRKLWHDNAVAFYGLK